MQYSQRRTIRYVDIDSKFNNKIMLDIYIYIDIIFTNLMLKSNFNISFSF